MSFIQKLKENSGFAMVGGIVLLMVIISALVLIF